MNAVANVKDPKATVTGLPKLYARSRVYFDSLFAKDLAKKDPQAAVRKMAGHLWNIVISMRLPGHGEEDRQRNFLEGVIGTYCQMYECEPSEEEFHIYDRCPKIEIFAALVILINEWSWLIDGVSKRDPTQARLMQIVVDEVGALISFGVPNRDE